MNRYCLTLDLKNDSATIAQYEAHHKKVWPEITKSIKDSGITAMAIYRFQTRLFMIMTVNDDFSFERKAEMDAQNETVEKWEKLMWDFQQPLAGAAPGSKWQLMDKIFDLSDYK